MYDSGFIGFKSRGSRGLGRGFRGGRSQGLGFRVVRSADFACTMSAASFPRQVSESRQPV